MDRTYPLTDMGTDRLIVVPVSFETNEVGTLKLPTLPYRCKLKSVKSAVAKVMAGTDAGTIAVKKGNTTLATVTIAHSDIVGVEDTAPTVTGTAFEKADQITITTAKTTAGGRALLYLTVEVLPSH
jgi:hypothetical protein